MTIKLPRIKYNVKDRGRKFLGQERNFDIKKLCDSINGGKCQEKVRTRALYGYYGHGVRKLVQMDVPEVAMVKGSLIKIEPAVVTTYIQAFPNGDIEQESEFLDTDSGQLAAKMYNSKVGGFSTAIDGNTYELYGIDWVKDPNYVSHRPYILDSIDNEDSILDSVAQEQEWFYKQLIHRQESQIFELSQALNRCQADNESMIDMLSKRNAKVMLDDSSFELPLLVCKNLAAAMLDSAEHFKTAKLPAINSTSQKEALEIAERLESAKSLVFF